MNEMTIEEKKEWLDSPRRKNSANRWLSGLKCLLGFHDYGKWHYYDFQDKGLGRSKARRCRDCGYRQSKERIL